MVFGLGVPDSYSQKPPLAYASEYVLVPRIQGRFFWSNQMRNPESIYAQAAEQVGYDIETGVPYGSSLNSLSGSEIEPTKARED